MGKVNKTGKPTEIEWVRQYTGQHGVIHVFSIEFDDGTSGEFTTTKKDQTKFTIGKEVDYTTEEKEDNRGNSYIRIDIDKEARQGGNGQYTGGKRAGLSKEISASIIASVCLDQAVTVFLKTGIADQVKPDMVAVHVLANKFYDFITAKSAGDNQKAINYQSRLKEVVGFLMDYKSLNIRSSDDILKYVQIEVDYIQSKMKQ